MCLSYFIKFIYISCVSEYMERSRKTHITCHFRSVNQSVTHEHNDEFEIINSSTNNSSTINSSTKNSSTQYIPIETCITDDIEG